MFYKKAIDVLEKTKSNYDEFYDRMQDFDHNDWFAAYLNSITEAFDPHTSYFPPMIKKEESV